MKKEFLQRLGGRKFILACVLIVLGTWIELGTERGMTMAYSTLMVGVLGAFAAANYGVTKAYAEKNKPISNGDGFKAQLDSILAEVQKTNDPESQRIFIDLLTNIKDTVEQVGVTAGNTLLTTSQTQKVVAAMATVKGVGNGSSGVNS